MLQLSASLINRPVWSLRSGDQIATTTGLVLNPNNFKIEGFHCIDRFSGDHVIVLSQDIRDNVAQGLIVNDHDALTDPDELIRLKDVLQINFEILGKLVVTVHKRRLGKVNDFAADNQSLYIQKIYVSQSILKSLNSGQLSIDRNQIVEVTDTKIIVQDPLQMTKAPIPTGMQAA